MKIAYGKLGRSYDLDIRNASVAGGDIDVVRGLQRLATAFPEATIYLLGRNSGERPEDVGLPPNIVNLWADDPLKSVKVIQYKSLTPHLQEHGVYDLIPELDAQVWWLGQHGTSNTEGGLPMIKDRTKRTDPQSSSVVYGQYIIDAINTWRDVDPIRREEVWLCPDPRNYVKCRDNRWPLNHPVLAQYDQVRNAKHERYDDPKEPWEYGFDRDRAHYDPDEPGLWKSKIDYVYSALELTALPSPQNCIFPDLTLDRLPFGVVSNENRRQVSRPRAKLIKRWIVDQFGIDTPLYGIWSDDGKADLGRDVQPIPYTKMLPMLRTFRTSCTFSASGSYWATAKPWEAFACGTIMFFHPDYDKQNHILRGLDQGIIDFLRVPDDPEELERRVITVNTNDGFYRDLATYLRQHYENRFNETNGGTRAIIDRIRATTAVDAPAIM